MSASNPSPNASSIQDRLFALAREKHLVISFRKGRRSNDVLVMHVEGDSEQVLDFYETIEQHFPEFGLELFNIPESPEFGLTSALTEPQPESEEGEPSEGEERRSHLHPLQVFSRPVEQMQRIKLGRESRPPHSAGHGTVSTLADLAEPKPAKETDMSTKLTAVSTLADLAEPKPEAHAEPEDDTTSARKP